MRQIMMPGVIMDPRKMRPQILEYVILECDLGENRIAERADGVDGRIDRLDWILLADAGNRATQGTRDGDARALGCLPVKQRHVVEARIERCAASRHEGPAVQSSAASLGRRASRCIT